MNTTTADQNAGDFWFGDSKPRVTTKQKIAKSEAKRAKLYKKMEAVQKQLILVNGDLSRLQELEEFESKLSKPKLLIVQDDKWAIQPMQANTTGNK